LHNCENAPLVLTQIESTIADCKNLDSRFRCWISLAQDDSKPPTSLMLNSVRVLVGGSSTTFKENLIRSFSWVEHENVKASNKPEWALFLHNMCYLHSCLRFRARFARCGWNETALMNFSTEELLETLAFATREYLTSDSRTPVETGVKTVNELSRNISLQGIKFMASQVIYGSSVINSQDMLTLESLAEHWIASLAIRKDFEVAKLKYKIPAAFYQQPIKLTALQQSFDNAISPLQLESGEGIFFFSSIFFFFIIEIFIINSNILFK
jgi:dynein heavy chain